jgi:hypothetical protein
MNTNYTNELAIEYGTARARKLRSLAIIDLTRRLYGLPLKAARAMTTGLGHQARNLEPECATC